MGHRRGPQARRRPVPAGQIAGAPAVRAGDPPRRGWLRPGSGPLGLPWLLALGAITVLPLAIYALSYLPWIELGNRWTADFPAGHTGQTFLELQRSMYDYHQYLRATHAAASPWWAWPIDLKPVWFEQGDYANGLTGVIYNTGNIVIFWLALPAVAFVAWQAWRRRSLALAVLVVAIACLWLPWARIDRATFQYHFLTSVPFTILALAYFLGELWHGPSRRTWLLARLAAAIAIIGPAALWLLRLPLCGLARTEQVNPGTEVCAGLSRQLVLTDLQAVGLLLVIGGLVGAGLLLQRPHLGGNRRLLVPGAVSVALIGVVIVLIGAGLPGNAVLELGVDAELPALFALGLLAVPAWFVLRARDARHFVAGALIAAGCWFVLFYPNFSGLPVPRPLAQVHLGLLPTWNWGFQFGVNMDEPNRAGPEWMSVIVLGFALVVAIVAVVYSIRAWRIERAARRLETSAG